MEQPVLMAPRITSITPIWERTNQLWLQQQTDSLSEAGVTHHAYAGPRHLTAQQHAAQSRTITVDTDSRNVAHKRNLLLGCTNTPWIVIADDDDLYQPGSLTELARRATPRHAAVLGAATDIDEDGNPLPSPPSPPGIYTLPELYDYWQQSIAHNPHGLLPFHMNAGIWNTRILKLINGWHQYVNGGRYGEDIVTALNAARLGIIEVVEVDVLRYRQHPGSLMKQATTRQEQEFHNTMKGLFANVHNQ